MKNTSIFKRFVSLVLCMVFVLGFVPVNTSAQGAAASARFAAAI